MKQSLSIGLLMISISLLSCEIISSQSAQRIESQDIKNNLIGQAYKELITIKSNYDWSTETITIIIPDTHGIIRQLMHQSKSHNFNQLELLDELGQRIEKYKESRISLGKWFIGIGIACLPLTYVSYRIFTKDDPKRWLALLTGMTGFCLPLFGGALIQETHWDSILESIEGYKKWELK